MSWQARVASALGAKVLSAVPVQGGDLSQVFRVDLADGRQVAVKLGKLVKAEARMLREIMRSGAAAPSVLFQENDLMCLEWLEETRATPEGWQSLGQTLRSLHDNAWGVYGWPEDYAFGTVTISNAQSDDWPRFWADQRLLPFVQLVPDTLSRRIEDLCASLGNRLPADPAAALLHGDLWTGNAVFSGPSAYLIDPACYRGHCEVDLSMLTLFGQPDRAFWSGYGTPDPGWEARRPIYQLWPALVHLTLFGAGYRGMVESLLDQAGA